MTWGIAIFTLIVWTGIIVELRRWSR